MIHGDGDNLGLEAIHHLIHIPTVRLQRDRSRCTPGHSCYLTFTVMARPQEIRLRRQQHLAQRLSRHNTRVGVLVNVKMPVFGTVSRHESCQGLKHGDSTTMSA